MNQVLSISLYIAGLGGTLGGLAIVARGARAKGDAVIALGNISFAIYHGFGHNYIALSLHSFFAAVAIWLWWNNPNGGGKAKKAARELGDKSRARVRALVDALMPQPVAQEAL